MVKKKEILKKLKELSKSERYKEGVELFYSTPGIGKLTAIRLVLEWGDLSRFKRKEEFADFLGIVPGEYSTGETERKGHITKQGNAQVRSWLVEAAWIAIRYDQVLLKKYRDICKRCSSPKKAIVAVARKLALRLRAVWLNKIPYVIGVIE